MAHFVARWEKKDNRKQKKGWEWEEGGRRGGIEPAESHQSECDVKRLKGETKRG